MFFAILLSILGSSIVIRMFESLIARDLFERAELTKIGTIYCAVVLLLAVALPRSHLWTWFAIFVPLALLALALCALVSRRVAEFKECVGEALALVSLKMKSGRSFRQAFSEVTIESGPRQRAKLSEIGSAVVFSQQNLRYGGGGFISEVIDELKRIDREPHAAARRLAVFREKLRIESEFRRRSGQVLSRIRAQSLLMTGLYLAIAIFIARKFGFQTNLRIFIASAGLFSVGAFWIWKGGRTLKWKV